MSKNNPYFLWRVEWVRYFDGIQSEIEKLNFARSIAVYGLYGKDANLLCGEDLDYFNEVIRPDLDEQRKRLKEGKKI